MMPVKTRLDLAKPGPSDMVIGSKGQLPILHGQDEESLICPGCGHEVTSGISAQTLISLFQPPARLLFHCQCDAYGVVGGAGG